LAKNAHGLTALGAAMTLMQASDKVRADVDGLRRQFDPMLVEEVIVKKDNPFEVLDEKGVGKLMELAVKWGRSVKPDLLVGICGEHGGHPAAIAFCDKIGLDYVSCSGPRVPVARLAAAHAALLAAKA